MEASLNGPLGRTALGQGTIKIGRAPDNTLVINDLQSSAHHAEVSPGFDGNSYQVSDLNSTNGTFVNDQRLTPSLPRPLNPGDVIRIGSMRFTYEAGSGYEPTVMAGAFNNDQTVPSQQPVAPPPAYQQPQAYPQPSAFNNYNTAPQPPMAPPSTPSQPPYAQGAYPPAGQPAYPQPPYQQPGSFGQPGYPPPEGYGQPKKSHRGLWIVLIIALLVIVVGGVAGFVYIQNRSTPEKTLQAYCTAFQNNDAQGLYNTLSSTSQTKTGVSKLSQGLQLLKLLVGNIGCSYSNVQQSGSTATATVTLTPARGKAESGTIHLINENGQWKIDETSALPNR